MTVSADDIENLLRDLSAPQRAVRTGAEEKLIRLGPRILAKLPSTDQVDDPAVREALLRIREKISNQKVRQALQASQVTLEGNFTLEGALREIERQTRNHVDVDASVRDRLAVSRSFNLKSVPFWDTLQKIAADYSICLTFASGRTHPLLVSVEQSKPSLAITTHGPFLWIWERAEVRPGVTVGKNLLRAHLIFAMEPRLRGLFATYFPSQMPLRISGGELLPPFNPGASIELPLGEGGHAVKCEVDYLLPTDSKPRAIDWEGNFSLLIAAGEERFELRPQQQTTGDSQRQGEVAVTFFPVQFDLMNQEKEIVRIPLALTYDRTGPAFESHRLWIFRNRAELALPDGKTLIPLDCETRLQQQNIVLMDYKFKISRAQVEKSTFTYFAPTQIVTEKIPFEFWGIPVGIK